MNRNHQKFSKKETKLLTIVCGLRPRTGSLVFQTTSQLVDRFMPDTHPPRSKTEKFDFHMKCNFLKLSLFNTTIIITSIILSRSSKRTIVIIRQLLANCLRRDEPSRDGRRATKGDLCTRPCGSSHFGPRTIGPRTVGPRTAGPRTVGPQGPIVHPQKMDNWAPDSWAPGPNYPF